MKRDGELGRFAWHRRGRWLTNRVEQDRRRIKRRTLAGVEAMAVLTKGQVRAVLADDVPAQRAFVHRVFGLAV